LKGDIYGDDSSGGKVSVKRETVCKKSKAIVKIEKVKKDIRVKRVIKPTVKAMIKGSF
jgi:hypothetical protein